MLRCMKMLSVCFLLVLAFSIEHVHPVWVIDVFKCGMYCTALLFYTGLVTFFVGFTVILICRIVSPEKCNFRMLYT